MKKILLGTIFISLLICGCGKKYEANIQKNELCNCNKVDSCECKNLYQTINSKQAKDMLYNSNTFLIDVRSTAEYNSGHIDTAISVPLDELNSIKFAKNINIIVYCRSGNRSKQAAEQLLQMGYVNVYDLGSMDNWYN